MWYSHFDVFIVFVFSNHAIAIDFAFAHETYFIAFIVHFYRLWATIKKEKRTTTKWNEDTNHINVDAL